MNIKEKGSFYTPQNIATWISKRALSSFKKEKILALEPSCGDGVFLHAMQKSLASSQSVEINAVEYDGQAYQFAREKYYKRATIVNADFLFWETDTFFDIVIGNPPYIVKKILTPEQAEQCKKIHAQAGLRDREVANIWTAFLVKSISQLNSRGVLGVVLPTELLQVNYAKEIREYLLSQFQRLEIISFRNLAFENIEQDTVIVMGYKSPSSPSGLYFAEVSSMDELSSDELKFEKHHGDYDAKWSSYILSEDEMSFVKKLSQKCSIVSDLCTAVAGIVTAANGYFIVSQEDVQKYNLEKYVKKIIQKGLYVNGSAEIVVRDYTNLRNSSKPCYIIDLNNVPVTEFSEGLKKYLALGVIQNIPERYKCKLRNRWYDVPSIWKSEGFFFKRGHHYPKLLVNKANVYVTDSAYRIRMNEGYDIQSFVSSFYNSLTLLHAELNGRYYGGGVLEVTPNEFKSLPLPYQTISSDDYCNFIDQFKNKSSIDEFLKEHDKAILSKAYNLSNEDISHLHTLYQKVKNRRLKGRYA